MVRRSVILDDVGGTNASYVYLSNLVFTKLTALDSYSVICCCYQIMIEFPSLFWKAEPDVMCILKRCYKKFLFSKCVH